LKKYIIIALEIESDIHFKTIFWQKRHSFWNGKTNFYD